MSGEKSTFTFFLDTQPDNNPLGDEDYVHMCHKMNGVDVNEGRWNDLSSPNKHYPELDPIHGVVEVKAAPETKKTAGDR